jgi:hypothetical protein
LDPHMVVYLGAWAGARDSQPSYKGGAGGALLG